MRIAPLLLAFGILPLLPTPSRGDTLVLKDGTTLSGSVSDLKDRYKVVDRDREYLIRKSNVVRYEKNRSFMDEYRKRLAALPAKDADKIYDFGLWLDKNDWPSRARLAYEEVLDLDPDHRGARRALGYRLFEGQWVSPAELNRKRGLVEFDGRWYTPHDLKNLKAEIDKNKEWKRALEAQRDVNRRINAIVAKFRTFDKAKREAAYHELYAYADSINSPELRKFADDVDAYYDRMVKILCARLKARTTIHAVHTTLKRPIDTFTTNLGAAIGTNSARTPVRIQLPEISIAEVNTTVDIPAGCD